MRISWKLFGDRYLIFLLYSQPADPMSRDCMIPSLPGAFRASFWRKIFLRQYNLATRALIQSFSRTGHRLIQGLQCSQILLCFNTAHSPRQATLRFLPGRVRPLSLRRTHFRQCCYYSTAEHAPKWKGGFRVLYGFFDSKVFQSATLNAKCFHGSAKE